MKTTDLPKVSDLTDEQLNILIAEECGWKCHAGWWHNLALEEFDHSQSPTYTESLDAMHKAESSMNDCEIEAYIDVLPLCAGSDLVPKGTASFVAYFATAKQRAQAFVVAKGRAVL